MIPAIQLVIVATIDVALIKINHGYLKIYLLLAIVKAVTTNIDNDPSINVSGTAPQNNKDELTEAKSVN